MAEYRLLTIWRIEAPLEAVYAAIHDVRRWPDWWPGVQKVEQAAAGDADGIDSVWRYSWQGPLPYRLEFEACPTRIEKLVAIEGTARGDLEGTGRWHFDRQGAVSIVRCEWHVRSTRWWMNLIAPLARPMFIRNHARVMARGGEGLARLLGSPLVGLENVDLMAQTAAPGAPPGRWRGRTGLALLAGVVAGTCATAVQLVLWWMARIPLPETLFRDARLTAAIVMGSGVLPPPATPRWDILAVATLVHFCLSFVYALIAARWFARQRTGRALVAGAWYGLAIYVVNLYGFTALLFPWFAVTRGWITLLAHLAFGVALAGTCRLFSARDTLDNGTPRRSPYVR